MTPVPPHISVCPGLAPSPPPPDPEQTRADIASLTEHADAMWKAELDNYHRFVFRGRLIFTSTSIFITLLVSISIIGNPFAAISDASIRSPLIAAILVGAILVAFGVGYALNATLNYVNHGEEDAGALPGPVAFGRIGSGWWLTQPTIETVEERYLLIAILRSLHWKRNGAGFELPIVFLVYRMVARTQRTIWIIRMRVLKAKLARMFNKDPALRRAAMEAYRARLAYDGFEYGVVGIRDRKPSDLASLIIAILLAHTDRQGERVIDEGTGLPVVGDHIIRSHLDEMAGYPPPDTRRFRNAYAVVASVHDNLKQLMTWQERMNLAAASTPLARLRAARKWVDRLGLPDRLRSVYDEPPEPHAAQVARNVQHPIQLEDWLQRPVSLHSKAHLDLLHHPIFVRSSSYYMQFSEAFAYTHCGVAFLNPDPNPTGSNRVWAAYEPDGAEARRQVAFTKPAWRSFVSRYAAAQDLRSSNWNLWFRVKTSERMFMKALVLVFLGLLVFVGTYIVHLWQGEEQVTNVRLVAPESGGD